MQGSGNVILGQPYLNSFEAKDETFVDELLMWNRRMSNLDEIAAIRMEFFLNVFTEFREISDKIYLSLQ